MGDGGPEIPPGSTSVAAALCRHHHRSRLLLLLLLPPLLSTADAISFNIPVRGFPDSLADVNISRQGDAFTRIDGGVDLTLNGREKNITSSAGRIVYSHPVHLWDNATRNLTNFTTHFSFVVEPLGSGSPGDGLTFFLAPYGSLVPENSKGEYLAVFNDTNSSSPSGYLPTVAVEFDTYSNAYDPKAVHVGIDIGSVKSVTTVNWATNNRWANTSINATVTYAAATTNLSAYFTDNNGTDRTVSHIVDLREVLPEWVCVGFSATTGLSVELHQILSWSFRSSLEIIGDNRDGSTAAPSVLQVPVRRKKNGILVGVLSAVGVLAATSGIAGFLIWRRRKTRRWNRGLAQEGGIDLQEEINNSDLQGGRGPKSFTYRDLARATKNFSPEMKLGRGGFGDVYKGVLHTDHGRTIKEVAIKRVAKDSRQGKKEYVSEVKIISRLRHRNLVQLVGWCHDRGELLLVYEYMPNGSLDAHLYHRRGEASPPAPLPWTTRYGIAQGVAAALLYLHEEWEQCVVHRDVKPSNVMLDANFNAKLGDFGLARLVDHGGGLQTTMLAGTMGYLAPECATSGKASKESDVYSFGVVALEIACGRRPIEPSAPEELLDWVWDLYGRNSVLEAADPRLKSEEIDKQQMERLMVVGLWCVHPDSRRRPSMKQVVTSLGFETTPPDLPAQMPVPSYGSPTGFDSGSKAWESSSSSTAAGTSSVGLRSSSTTGASTAWTCSSTRATSPLLLSTEPH